MNLMAKLYELTGDYRKVWEMVDDEGVDLAVIEDTLQSIEGEIEIKANSVACIIRNLNYDINTLNAEIERLTRLKQTRTNAVEGLKKYVQYQMGLAGIDKIKTPLQTLVIQNNPPSVLIEDEKAIPAKFLTVIPQTTVPNKKDIATAIKAGEVVPGCSLMQGKSLRIR